MPCVFRCQIPIWRNVQIEFVFRCAARALAWGRLAGSLSTGWLKARPQSKMFLGGRTEGATIGPSAARCRAAARTQPPADSPGLTLCYRMMGGCTVWCGKMCLGVVQRAASRPRGGWGNPHGTFWLLAARGLLGKMLEMLQECLGRRQISNQLGLISL